MQQTIEFFLGGLCVRDFVVAVAESGGSIWCAQVTEAPKSSKKGINPVANGKQSILTSSLLPNPPSRYNHCSRAQVTEVLKKSKKGKIPLVNGGGELLGLATRAMVKEARSFPAPGAPNVDAAGRLRVGAAIGTRDDDKQRVAQLFEVGKVRLGVPRHVQSIVFRCLTAGWHCHPECSGRQAFVLI